MAEQPEYDVIVVGGGSTGENAAWYARRNGLTAVVVESELIGGECSYWACMPSKALLRPGEALATARRVPAAQPAVTGDAGRVPRGGRPAPGARHSRWVAVHRR